MNITLVYDVETTDDGVSWWVEVVELPELFAGGPSVVEARTRALDAARELLAEAGQSLGDVIEHLRKADEPSKSAAQAAPGDDGQSAGVGRILQLVA